MPRQLLSDLLAKADIQLDGSRPWDLIIKDERACSRILREHNLGLGETYMDGWVDCSAWDEFIFRIFRSPLAEAVLSNRRLLLYAVSGAVRNWGNKARAFQIGERHYDTGNDLYERMLDKRMTYTCGYWKDAATLDLAQEAKLDLTCRKLGLRAGQTVLDIGCGWGSFVRFAAERYGVKAIGITVSKEQAVLARKRCQGLPVEIRLQDYRDVQDTFDHVVSLGMFEHVCHQNHRTFMKVVHRVLRDNGLCLLHTIGSLRSTTTSDPWFLKYIFPNSMLPSVAQIGKSVEGLFVMEDWHNFGADYDKTLMAWHANVEAAWTELAAKYGERFHRMWTYYLRTMAGAFRARYNQLWQVVLSKHGVSGGYVSIR